VDTTIAAGGYEAVVTDAGGGLRSLTHRGRPLVAGTAPDEVVTGGRGQVLVPWPNRLRDGTYTFDGATQRLALSEPARGNASHGLVRWCRWQPGAASADTATMVYRLVGQSGYPWSLDVSVGYAVSPAGLAVTLSATNRSASAAPFAAGMHPYLDVGCPLDEATLTLPAATHQLVDDRLLPTGTELVAGDLDLRAGRSLAGVRLDDAFTDLGRDADGLAVVRLEGRRAVELWQDDAWPWVQVFTGDGLPTGARQALAVEPMSAPADAFNSGRDLVVLGPGEGWSGRFGIRAG
jgi:aldose 1-epimerase